MYHCGIAASNPQQWAAMPRDAQGYFRRIEHEEAVVEESRVWKARLMSLLQQDGRADAAARLQRADVEGYANEDEMPLYAQMLGGAVEIAPLQPDGRAAAQRAKCSDQSPQVGSRLLSIPAGVSAPRRRSGAAQRPWAAASAKAAAAVGRSSRAGARCLAKAGPWTSWRSLGAKARWWLASA